jgi:hypothetical protein
VVFKNKIKIISISPSWFSGNNIITSNQSGFTFGDSAINQLVNISNDFGRALDGGEEIRVVFCDISKAFDRAF